jgi:hypothetical protein
MQIEVEPNPNCQGSEQYIFNEIEETRPIRGIRVEDRGREVVCDVTGVSTGGGWVQAYATKINDSGNGTAYLITGGEWGIRIKPSHLTGEPWSLTNERQWGEPFKVYGEAEDIIYQ